MLRRRIYDDLVRWKRDHEGECLLLNGARQVGKTFIVEELGRSEYGSLISVNFIRNPECKAAFEGALDPGEVLKRLSALVPGARLVPGDTLLFLDEVQACRKARTALKFLAADRRIDVIASGSLLGVHYRPDDGAPEEELSVPVGYEREVVMHSLDFEEYLWACGVAREAIDVLREAFGERAPLDGALLRRYQALLREYLVVGGMPAVVSAFRSAGDFAAAFGEQDKILQAYRSDIGRYATGPERPKVRRVYESIPRQLAKEYTKFQYSKVDKGGSARKYGGSIGWLVDAGLVGAVPNVSLPVLPLAAYEMPGEFKVYASDIGLATHLFGAETQRALYRGDLRGPAKGGIYENLVFDMLSKRGAKLFYYKKDNSSQEIEFLLERDGRAVPVEVKAKRGATPSLNGYIEEHDPPLAYKLIDGNVGAQGCKVTVPHFMAMFI